MSNEVMLCGRPNRCCPSMKKEADVYVLKDDFGGKVKLTSEQLNEIPRAKKLLDKQ